MNAPLTTPFLADETPDAPSFLAEEIAPLSVDVLIEGETGTGKDMLAREIHRRSRRQGKFIAINCAAVPENIAESELFGYEVGAFTGASRPKEGKLELADQGTLYLDEIDSMPLNIQAKLLRALQERGTERLGGSRFYRSDFRVIASTKIALLTLAEQGSFRKDLYYRLNVVKLRLPSLRDAREKILPLFTEFLTDACRRHGRTRPTTAGSIQKLLMEYPWPGNIRELKNAAERYALGLPPVEDESNGDIGTPAVEAAPLQSTDDVSLSLRERVRLFEREVILSTLRRHNQAVAKAARELQMSVNTLYYRIRILGIRMDGGPLPATPHLTPPEMDPVQVVPGNDNERNLRAEATESASAECTPTLAAPLRLCIKERFTVTFKQLVETKVARADQLIFPHHEFVGALLDALSHARKTTPGDEPCADGPPDHWVPGAIDTVREAIQDICAELRRPTGNFLQDMVNSQAADRYARTARGALENFRPRMVDTQQVFDKLASMPALADVARSNVWRLCLDPIKVDLMHAKGLGIDDNPYIGHLFDSESSYLFKMGRGWLSAVNDLKKRLDLAMIVRLHALASIDGEAAVSSLLPDVCGAWAQFGMLPGETVTADGERELQQFIEDRGVQGGYDSAIRFSFYTKRGIGGAEYKIFKRDEALPADQASLMNRWIDDYSNTLSAKEASRQDKVRAAAGLCQQMQRLRPFPDGNCRTFCILLLNRLLLQLGEPLTMIDNPNKLDGFSLAEIVDLVREGQERVRGWKKV
ncbi:sigma 54-interacting transcriptional regulator [Noviherbaspirillum saxi]|uniref:Sigma-54-dependent Fis family transcriptional regulator n=1 Tax=Noviherbaspirillum saxi TaxID=2320863 RepID=A0A3A3FGB9_9BURK|nr:sigma-54 dependent transcriptional regulator [Noviherbaspirillum saxi]RJF92147.1 sigma-54-dependent Fis family transcriptional regulator [Noviherbaspirillum saxi]